MMKKMKNVLTKGIFVAIGWVMCLIFINLEIDVDPAYLTHKICANDIVVKEYEEISGIQIEVFWDDSCILVL